MMMGKLKEKEKNISVYSLSLSLESIFTRSLIFLLICESRKECEFCNFLMMIEMF